MLDLSRLDFARGSGLISVVAQNAITGHVLMVAHADREALERTLQTGEMHYYSRTRGLWHKGATSGHRQRVVSLTPDCDGDAVLARVIPAGPACHTGAESCFAGGDCGGALDVLDATIARRAVDIEEPCGSHNAVRQTRRSYTVELLRNRNLRLKKLGEEAAELVMACADADRQQAAQEVADLIYHALVALRATGGSLSDVQYTLTERASGLSWASSDAEVGPTSASDNAGL